MILAQHGLRRSLDMLDEIVGFARCRRLDVRHIPATFEGRARVNIKNALAAVGAAWGSNIALDSIRNGLRTFTTSFFQAPGRLNLLEVGGYRVIVDYCHNVAGLEELAEFVKRMLPHRTVGMIAMPGDRRNEDVPPAFV